MSSLFKVLVTGSRKWADVELIRSEIRREREYAKSRGKELVVIHGDCEGADKQSGMVCRTEGIHYMPVPALWGVFGKAAGPLRNDVMVSMRPDIGLVFHEDLANSKGTKDCVERLAKAGIYYRIITGNPQESI